MKLKTLKFAIFTLFLLGLTSACQKDGEANFNIANNPGGTGVGGSLARFTIVDEYLYVVDENSMSIFKLEENGIKPTVVNKINIPHFVETIFPRNNNTLFIGTMSGMLIYNISNKTNPQLLSTYQHVVACDPVVANENYAYVTLRSNDQAGGFCNFSVNKLDVIDISDLRNPILISELQMQNPMGLGLLTQDTLLVCDQGISIIDVSDENNPTKVGHIDMPEALDLIPLNNSIIVLSPKKIRQYAYENGDFNYLSTIE